MVFVTALLTGCTIDNEGFRASQSPLTTAEQAKPTSNEQYRVSENSYCDTIESLEWRKACLAYAEKKSENCRYHDDLKTAPFSSRNCYWELAVHTDAELCNEIEGPRKYFCKAVAYRNYSYCDYIGNVEEEFSCLNYLLSETENVAICKEIGSRENELVSSGFIQSEPLQYDGTAYEGRVEFEKSEEHCLWMLARNEKDDIERYIENPDTLFVRNFSSMCQKFHLENCDEQRHLEKQSCLYCKAVDETNSELCLLTEGTKRYMCFTHLALKEQNPRLCNELEGRRLRDCIDRYGMFSDVSACRQHNDLIEKEKCILSAINVMDRTKQPIEPSICQNLSQEKVYKCYLRHAQTSLRADTVT